MNDEVLITALRGRFPLHSLFFLNNSMKLGHQAAEDWCLSHLKKSKRPKKRPSDQNEETKENKKQKSTDDIPTLIPISNIESQGTS